MLLFILYMEKNQTTKFTLLMFAPVFTWPGISNLINWVTAVINSVDKDV